MPKAMYARHAVDAYDKPWLADLPWATRMVWTPLLLEMKRKGGVLVNMTPEKFAVLIDAPAKSVKEFVVAATHKGSLVIEGRDWHLKNYDEWQTDKTVSDRVRAHRERKRNMDETRAPSVSETVGNEGETRYTGVSETSGNSEVTPPINEKLETRNDPVGSNEPTAAGGGSNASVQGAWRSLDDPLPEVPPEELEWFDRVAWTLRTIQEKAGWKAVLRADVTTHIAPGKPVRSLIELYGEVETVAIFLFAHATWSAEKRPTWSAVLAQREQIRERMQKFKPDQENFPDRAATSVMSNRDLARETLRLIAEGRK